MRKLNLLSNSRIILFINDDDPIRIEPDQIPVLILDALINAAYGETILSLALFADDSYDNYVRANITTWDGIVASKRILKLFGDGSFSHITDEYGSTCWGIL